jgi:hypothetical protein
MLHSWYAHRVPNFSGLNTANNAMVYLAVFGLRYVCVSAGEGK